MNKIIFQVGLLALCVAVVVFSTMGHDVLDVIAKSFIVFVASIVIMVGVIVATSLLSVREKTDPKETGEAA
jgi:cation transporter-like permease